VAAAAWTGPRVVPLYDGLGFPDQPYEYVGQNNAPQAVQQDYSADKVAGPGITLQSAESGPQVKVVFAHGSIIMPAGTDHLTVSATPEAISQQPSSAAIAGNVYRIAATGPGTTEIKPGFAAVYLRLPQGVSFHSPPVVVFRPTDGPWRQLATLQSGNDIYSASFAGWGEYALALASHSAGATAASAATRHRASTWWWPAVIAGLIALMIVAIRLANTKHVPAKKR
jgi:hypothetical protein